MKVNAPFAEHVLPNGLRIIMEIMPDVGSAAAGFFARTGGRDETRELAGVSHFLEHMCFKGTSRRGWREINIDFDNMGSTYNAYTMKDRTFYYGWVPHDSIADQIELLADMMRSTLPQEEFDMEKKVILEEIAMSNDRIEHIAYDFLHEQVFGDHALSWPVLGYEQTIRDLTRDQMNEYFQRRYAPDNLFLIVSGAIVPQQIIEVVEQHCGAWSPAGDANGRRKPMLRPGRSNKVVGRFNRQEIAFIYETPGGTDAMNETAEVLASVLGGENSRFYWHIVQEGLSPHAGVWRVDYEDCGLMILAGECDPQRCEELAEAMQREALRITREGATAEEVQRVKNRRRTAVALESEAPYYRLGQLLDDIDYRGRPRRVEDRLAEVDAVTPQRIAAYLERYPITGGGHFVSVGPRDWVRED